jgi:hypothetical protein
MTTVRGRLFTAGLILGFQGCGPSVPIAPPPPPLPGSPVAMQVAPGLGCSLQSVGTVYLVVNAVDVKNRIVLPRLSEVIAAELRAATPAPVILLVDSGLDCPPAADWGDMCRACHVPLEDPPPSAVVVFCDILEYDPYTPLRVGLSMRIRRATDGMELVALQGTWIGTPPITPRLPPFHWLMRKLPPRPNVDFTWTAQFETQSATELVRVAVDQCVSQLQSGQRTTQAFVPSEMSPQFEEPVPPAPPALPEATQPAMDSPIDVLPAPEAPPPTPGISTLDEPESAP